MFSEALRLIRVFHDMKPVELAEKLGISASYLSEIESGKKRPSLDLIEKYAKVFKTTPASILFFSDELSESTAKGPFKTSVRNKIFKLLSALEQFSIEEYPPTKK